MNQVEPKNSRRGPWATLVIAASVAASAVAIAFPATSSADPQPAPPVPPTAAVGPPPGQAPPPPADPNAPPPPPADPNAPLPIEPNTGRIDNAVGGFSFALPAGWVESDASHLDYGSVLLSKTTGQPTAPGQAPPVANDTRIVLGRLDQKLYASAEANNPKAALRLGSDMGEFFLPYPGTRINQESAPLTGANGLSGSASFYEVKFSDASKPNGQIWTGVIGAPAGNTANGGPPQRWFVVWLGTANNPVDRGAAKALAESIESWTAPPAAAAGPEQVVPVAPGAVPAPLGIAPAPPPAGDVAPPAAPAAPNPALVPQRTLPPS